MKHFELFLLINILFFISCSSEAGEQAPVEGEPFPEISLNEYQQVRELYSKSGKRLGIVYVKYINEDVFTSLVIRKEAEAKGGILYVIDKTRLISKDGVDTEVYPKGFYGYRLVLLKNDYIVLTAHGNKGKTVSDDITIEWDYDAKMFKLLKYP